MKTKHKILLITSILGLLSACAKDDEADSAIDPVEASLESGITVLSGIADDQAGSSFAMSKKPVQHPFELLLAEPAFAAAACGRAVSQACASGGVKSVNYNGCQVGLASSLSGSVTLDYSDNSCSMAANGNFVTRTYNWTLKGPRGGTLTRSSNSMSDYTGNTYGGGGRLTKTVSGFDLEVLGTHTELKGPRGTVLYDVSVRTTSAIGLDQVVRNGRTMNGGALEVNHNLAGFTAVFVPNNVEWSSSSCCHPTSGSMTVTYSGSRTGSATMSFGPTRGTATVTSGSTTQNIVLGFCE
jgi:hypothetical protein